MYKWAFYTHFDSFLFLYYRSNQILEFVCLMLICVWRNSELLFQLTCVKSDLSFQMKTSVHDLVLESQSWASHVSGPGILNRKAKLSQLAEFEDSCLKMGNHMQTLDKEEHKENWLLT